MKRAFIGSFVKDLTPQNRSLGIVIDIDKKTNMMLVNFPKTFKKSWVLWNNMGQYLVVS